MDSVFELQYNLSDERDEAGIEQDFYEYCEVEEDVESLSIDWDASLVDFVPLPRLMNEDLEPFEDMHDYEEKLHNDVVVSSA